MKRIALFLFLLPACAQDPFYGAVPQGQASADTLRISLADAIARGLKTNLGALLSAERTRGAEGAQLVSRSRLLPNLSAHVGESAQQLNLAAFGFTGIEGVNPVIGPFGLFDARAFLSQTLLDFRARDNARAASHETQAARLSYQDARDTVALVVASLYLQTLHAAGLIDSAQVQVQAAQALYDQAVEFKKAGTVPAIDVLRAQVELQSQRQRLIVLRNGLEKLKLRLGRAIGLPDGQAIELTDRIPRTPAVAPPIDEALKTAYASRSDYQSLAARVKAAEFTRRAASAGRWPSINFQGNYGVLGQSIVQNHGTFTATVSLDMPVFDGGRIKGEEIQADAALQQQRDQLAELRGRIAVEVRSASLDLKAAADAVEVASSAVELSHQQLAQARDRFAAGVTNNLEVVQAQEAVAHADESYIFSLYSFNLAKADLARAVGGIETKLPGLLLGTN